MAQDMYEEIRNREPKVSIGARVKVIDLATIASYLVSKDIAPKNRSDLVCAAVEIAAKITLVRDEVMGFETNSEAIDYLNKLGLNIEQGHGKIGTMRSRQFDELSEAAREQQELERLQEKYKDTAKKMWDAPVREPTTKEDILARYEAQERSSRTEVKEEHLPPKADKLPDNLKIHKDS